MNYLVENILDVMKLAIIFELGLHKKKKKEIKHYITACVLFVAATLLQHRSFYPILLYLFWVLTVTVIIYGEDLIKKIMVALCSVGIIGSMDGFLYVFTQKLFTNHIIQVLSASVMTIIILYGLFKGFGKRHQYVLQNVQVKYFVYHERDCNDLFTTWQNYDRARLGRGLSYRK